MLAHTMADPSADPVYVEKTVTAQMIQEAEAAHAELGEAVVPFGANKGKALKDLIYKDLWELSEFSVKGSRDEYCIKAPTRRFCPEFGFTKWVVHNHYPLAIMARRYLYELRDLKFRFKLQEMKAKTGNHFNCAKCYEPMLQALPVRRHWDSSFHKVCWIEMVEEEKLADGHYDPSAHGGRSVKRALMSYDEEA
jgi:hypothetical protein